MVFAGEETALEMLSIVAAADEQAIYRLLNFRVKGIQSLVATVEVEAMGAGGGHVGAQVLPKGFGHGVVAERKGARPMRGQAGSSAKHAGIFAHGIHRYQSAHAASRYKSLAWLPVGGEMSVDIRL